MSEIARIGHQFKLGLSRHHSGGGSNVERLGSTFVQTLSRLLGSPVNLQIDDDYEKLLESLLRGSVSVAWLPPLLHARGAELGGKLVAVTQRGGWLTFRAGILVRKDAPFASIGALKQVRAAWREHNSASGYLFPRLELKGAGATFAEEKFAGTLEEGARRVAFGEADLCTCFLSEAAVTDPERAQADARTAVGAWADSLRVLHITDSIPPDGFMLSPSLPHPQQEALKKALLSLHSDPAGREVLQGLLQADRLSPVTEALVASLQSWADAARARVG